jgi:hypothetical protein
MFVRCTSASGRQHVHRPQQHRAFLDVAVLVELPRLAAHDGDRGQQRRGGEVAAPPRVEVDGRRADAHAAAADRLAADPPRQAREQHRQPPAVGAHFGGGGAHDGGVVAEPRFEQREVRHRGTA